ncbi:HNH endonuclease [Billgrantia bachuensis]|uniref:HNH endonuclease n=1 Tax=Billgrantia bachuensis TaxID=2717286 RepID=A0ABX0PPK6_9GAMM|nr:HNH endonuclease [Halomonas bachuensis]NIC05239.1 HNH endonuclease [Halomonas bachuensis]
MKRLTKTEREQVRLKFGGRCAYCGEELGKRWHADHLEAVRRRHELYRDEKGRHQARVVGADFEERHVLDNMMPACAPCNISKAAYSLERWRDVLVGYVGALHRNNPTYRVAKKHGLIAETVKPVVFYFETLEGGK